MRRFFAAAVEAAVETVPSGARRAPFRLDARFES
jgi:hypothetical protein